MRKTKQKEPSITEGPGRSVPGTVWIDIVTPEDELVTRGLLQAALDSLRTMAQLKGWTRASVWIEMAGNGDLVWHRLCVANAEANVAVPADAMLVAENTPLASAPSSRTVQ